MTIFLFINTVALKKLIFGLSGVFAVFFFIAVAFKGILYDRARKKLDSTYKESRSIYSLNYKVLFPIPLSMFYESTNTEIIRYKKEYNRIAYGFWIAVLLAITFHL